jgi:hypothetical protein
MQNLHVKIAWRIKCNIMAQTYHHCTVIEQYVPRANASTCCDCTRLVVTVCTNKQHTLSNALSTPTLMFGVL